jgi:ADP-heptose:LPS heptosyltransferase
MKQLIFKQMQSPGDLLMLTVALRDLHLTYPNEYETDVISCYPEVFFNNKYITTLPKDKNICVIDLDYGAYLHRFRKQGYHFSDCFRLMLNGLLDLNIRKTSSRPYIKLTPYELCKQLVLDKFGLKKPYWLMNAGIKNDIPLKQYPPKHYQTVINYLNARPDFYCDIVQTGHDFHIHPKLDGVTNLVGKTNNMRDYFALMYHAEGCIGPVSLQMHLAAAFNKPCVVLAGGREEPSWEKYSDHKYLNTIGMLGCCFDEGCWKKYIGECVHINDSQRYPACMEMIAPEMVVYEVMQYQLLKQYDNKEISN